MDQEILEKFWPREDQVDFAIRYDAETDHDSVVLATHQPMLMYREVGNTREFHENGEEKFLEEFTSDSHITSSGSLVMPVLGPSGVGKSHLIRWVDLQLRRRNIDGRQHILRIPKNFTFRRVLELLLDALGDEHFPEVRQELESSRAERDEMELAERLRRGLSTALRYRAEEIKRNGETSTKEEEWTHCNMLPGLLNDPVAGKQLIDGNDGNDGVLLHLIQRALSSDALESDKVRREFEPADLELDTSDLQDWSKPARSYYGLLDNSALQGMRTGAVDVLNSVLDHAVSEVLNIQSADLTELFRQIRKGLQKEGKELVLLIEDFATMTGIRNNFLEAAIEDAYRNGELVLCPMRTALVMTTGYLRNHATLETRTPAKWYVAELRNEREAIFKRYIELFGSYLNAARMGERLEEVYISGGKFDERSRYPGKESLDENQLQILKRFGESEKGYSLFPFNPKAVRALAKIYSVNQAQELIYNPRAVIVHVLRQWVRDYRDNAEQGHFPFAKMGDGILGEDVMRLLTSQQNKDVPRYESFLRVWGDCPKDLHQLSTIHDDLYRFWGLTPLKTGGALPPKTPNPTVVSKDMSVGGQIAARTVTRSPEAQKQQKLIDGWYNKIQQWAGGGEFMQQDSNTLRGWIFDGLKASIDWSFELMASPELFSQATWLKKRVYIANSKGGASSDSQDSFVVFCSEQEYQGDGWSTSKIDFVSELMALVRFNAYGNVWTYDKSHIDMAYYSRLMDRLTPNAIAFTKEHLFRGQVDPMPYLVRALQVSGRVLRVPHSSVRTKQAESQINALFEVVDKDAASSCKYSDERWNELKRMLFGVRPKMQEQLLAFISARQGTGKKALAVDASQLKPLLRSSLSEDDFVFTDEASAMDSTSFKEIKQNITSLNSKLNLAVRDETRSLQAWAEKQLDWYNLPKDYESLSEEIDKVYEEFEEVIGLAHEESLYRHRDSSVDAPKLLKHLQELRTLAVAHYLGRIDRLDESAADLDAVLGILSEVPCEVLSKSTFFREQFAIFLRETSKRVETVASQSVTVAMVEQQRDQFVGWLDGIDEHLEKVDSLLSDKEQ